MLDPELFAEFEAWRGAKVLGQHDLSVAAFNAEMETQALAYEAGVKDALGRGPGVTMQEVLDDNPYRKPGMRGERSAPDVPARRATFTPIALGESNEIEQD